MSDESLSRRQVLGTAAGFLSAAALGCGGKVDPKPEGPKNRRAEVAGPMAPVSSVGWELIAKGSDGPGPRSRHGLAYDRKAKAVVLFGGVVWTPQWSFPADTWELRGRIWHRVKGSAAPEPRHRAAMSYLNNRDQTLLFGGQNQRNAILRDTWTYAQERWQRVDTGANAPAARCGHSLAFDEQAGVAVLFGGVSSWQNSLADTWLFDGSAWKQVRGSGPSARRYAAFAYNPDLKGCLLHGGSEDDVGEKSFGDAWLFKDNAWKKLPASFETDARDDHALGYHQISKRMVMLEGVAGKRGLLAADEKGWQEVAANPLHPRHQCSPMVWNADLGGLLIHGGEAHQEGNQLDTTLLLRMPV